MRLQSIVLASAGLGFIAGIVPLAKPISAQDFPQAERLASLRERCDQDDRRACVRFGIMLSHMRDRFGDLRATRPDLFWWERQGDQDDQDSQ
jgi:hypothetical protein